MAFHNGGALPHCTVGKQCCGGSQSVPRDGVISVVIWVHRKAHQVLHPSRRGVLLLICDGLLGSHGQYIHC